MVIEDHVSSGVVRRFILKPIPTLGSRIPREKRYLLALDDRLYSLVANEVFDSLVGTERGSLDSTIKMCVRLSRYWLKKLSLFGRQALGYRTSIFGDWLEKNDSGIIQCKTKT